MRSIWFSWKSRCELLGRLWVDVLAAGGARVELAGLSPHLPGLGEPRKESVVVDQGRGSHSTRRRAGGDLFWTILPLLDLGLLARVGSMREACNFLF